MTKEREELICCMLAENPIRRAFLAGWNNKEKELADVEEYWQKQADLSPEEFRRWEETSPAYKLEPNEEALELLDLVRQLEKSIYGETEFCQSVLSAYCKGSAAVSTNKREGDRVQVYLVSGGINS